MGLIVERIPWRMGLVCLLLGPAIPVGCSDSSKGGKVSSSMFLAPVGDTEAADGGATKTLATQTDFLRALDPTAAPGDLDDETTDSSVISPLDEEEILINERRSGAIFRLDLGTDFADPDCVNTLDDRNLDLQPDCERVRLSYTNEGFTEAVRSQGRAFLASDVEAIQLRSGWVLAFEFATKTIIAFKELPPREISFGEAGSILLPYRSTRNPDNLNFGRGNGVVISEVLGQTELREKTGGVTVQRFFEIEENKVLVFFSTIPAIHLLELREEEEPVDYDLQFNPEDERDVFPTPLLRGEIKLFPNVTVEGVIDEPFLTYADLATFTGSVDLQITEFPPVTIPSNGGALIFDQTSSSFLLVGTLHRIDPMTGKPTDEVIGSVARIAVSSSTVRDTLAAFLGPGAADDPLRMRGSFFNPATRATEVLIMEEETNNIVAYDYEAPLGDNLRIYVPQSAVVAPRTPDGGTQSEISGIDPELFFSTGDVRDNRLTFDDGLDRMLGMSYSAGQLIIVLGRLDLVAETGQTVVDLTYLQPLDENRVRGFDAASSSLLAIRLTYKTVPVEGGSN
jgi:hypothetical protein